MPVFEPRLPEGVLMADTKGCAGLGIGHRTEVRVRRGKPIVEREDEPGEEPLRTAGIAEPVFFVPEIRSLRLPEAAAGAETSRFLSQHAARNPADLRSQIQRIHLHLAHKDADRLYGALVDLFITLGDKGAALRRRMLGLCKPLLGPERHRALSDKLQQGLSFSDRIPFASESRLSKGILGSCRLVERDDAADTRQLDIMEEVNSYLEFGQLAQARQALEAAVLRMPWRGELRAQLLELYERTEDRQRLLAMRSLLGAVANPSAGSWRALAKRFPSMDLEESPS